VCSAELFFERDRAAVLLQEIAECLIGQLLEILDAVAGERLKGSLEQAYDLVRTYPAEQMRIVLSGLEKKDLLDAAANSLNARL
jgi:hypothetical protein